MGGPSPTEKTHEQPVDPEEVRFHYGWIRLVQDLFEVICLTWVFAALGFFETGTEESPHRGSLWWAMAAAFFVPPLFRGLRLMFEGSLPQNEKLNADEKKDASGLSILSMLAVALCLAEAALVEAPLVIAFLIFVLLVAYVCIFIVRRRSRKA